MRSPSSHWGRDISVIASTPDVIKEPSAEEAELSRFDAQLERLTHGLYSRMRCEEGILITNGAKGYWFRCLADAYEYLKGWQV